MYAFNYDTWATRAPDDDEETGAEETGAEQVDEHYLTAADSSQMREIHAHHQLIKELATAPEGEENDVADTYDPRDRF